MENIVVAITGASGAIYGIRIIENLKNMGVKVHLLISNAGKKTVELETNYRIEQIERLADKVYRNEDIWEGIASGSYKVDAMVIAPCSIKTLSSVANSYSDTLISRSADVCLKERRKLILMVRETPYHIGHIDLMRKASEMGAIILPPNVAMYTKPKSVEDIVNHTVGKALDLLGIDNELYNRWK